MKTTWLVSRIALVLIAIFVLGIWVGRLTAPQSTSEVAVVLPESEGASERQIQRVTKRAMRRYRRDLGLSQEQMSELKPLFIEVSHRMEMLPVRSKARLAVLEEFHGQIEDYLTPEQKRLADKILKKSREQDRK